MAKSDKMEVDASPSKTEKQEKESVPYETRVLSISPIAHPLASKKLSKKVLKTVKKGEGSLCVEGHGWGIGVFVGTEDGKFVGEFIRLQRSNAVISQTAYPCWWNS
jgi:hypothetical protein